MNNNERAERAAAAVRAYVKQNTDFYADEEDETHLADLLCDLRHWADRQGVNWYTAEMRGGMNHSAEVDEEAYDRDEAS